MSDKMKPVVMIFRKNTTALIDGKAIALPPGTYHLIRCENPAPYPLEQYAAAAEDLGNQPLTPYEVGDPLQYAQSLNWEKGWRAAALTFAQMLRGTPTSLYTNWPAYFPDPCAGDYDPNQFRVYDNLPQELSDKQDELLKEIGPDPGAGDKGDGE